MAEPCAGVVQHEVQDSVLGFFRDWCRLELAYHPSFEDGIREIHGARQDWNGRVEKVLSGLKTLAGRIILVGR